MKHPKKVSSWACGDLLERLKPQSAAFTDEETIALWLEIPAKQVRKFSSTAPKVWSQYQPAHSFQ